MKQMKQDGYITFVVLWMGMVSLLFSYGICQSARNDYRLARIEADEVSSFYCAESGMARFREKVRAQKTQNELLRLVDNLTYQDCPCPEHHTLVYWLRVPFWWDTRVDGSLSVSAIQKNVMWTARLCRNSRAAMIKMESFNPSNFQSIAKKR